MCLTEGELFFCLFGVPLILLVAAILSVYLIVRWARRRAAQRESGESGAYTQLNILREN